MYIKIANKSGFVNRLYLEKLGISTKRESENTIGQFGSGVKFAPIAALRKGWEWITTGADEFGPYEMRYDVRNTGGINEIIFDYGSGVIKESSYTLEAGTLSWQDDFQIIREALANAIDAHIETGEDWYWKIVDHVDNIPDEFAVYITDADTGEAPEEVLEILDNFDDWFSIDRQVFVENNFGKFFKRTKNDSLMKIFYKGVRVHEINTDGFETLFDYQLNGIVLNEERRMRNAYDVDNKVFQLWSGLDEENSGIISTILQKMESSYELYRFDGWYIKSRDWSEIWKDEWYKIYGLKAVPVSSDVDAFIVDRIKNKRHKPVLVPRNLFDILGSAGVKMPMEILGKDWNVETVDITAEQRGFFDEGINLLNKAGFNIDASNFKFYIDDDETLGKAIDGVSYLNEKILTENNLEQIIATIAHENDHIVSGLHDSDEAFRHVADEHIARLVIANYGGEK